MRTVLAIAVAMLLVPACKSGKQAQTISQVQKEAPDAKPTLHVAEDDPRYVAAPNATSRQVHYYSAKTDTTYVIDERTGKVVRTFKSKQMPGVVVVDKPTYQPPPLAAEPAKAAPSEGCGAKEGCGAVEEVTEGVEVVEPEGCADGCGK
ncbi:MAG TPA: hypothetical protein VFY93_12755 [Planctomycetota bacterium]|nr:hypothetical protein [Planctomycetota bacterium]